MKPYHLVITVGATTLPFERVRVVPISALEPASASPQASDGAELSASEGPVLSPSSTTVDEAGADAGEGPLSVDDHDVESRKGDADEPVVLDPVLEPLAACGLKAADFRSRVLVVIGDDVSAESATFTVAMLSMLAGRRLDVLVGNEVLVAETFPPAASASLESGPATAADSTASVVAVDVDAELVVGDGDLDANDAARMRWSARRVAIEVTDPLSTVRRWMTVAAWRAHHHQDRLPAIVYRDCWVDVEPWRPKMAVLRRLQRGPTDVVLVPAVDPPEAFAELMAAAATDPVTVLTALGSESSDGEVWRCPRPGRHRNGDANASMKVDGHRVRCFRCDPEKIDMVRLVADVKQCTFDEAAHWLTTTASQASSG